MMPETMRALVVLLCCAVLLGSGEGAALAALDQAPAPRPGGEAPAHPAEPCVIRFDWDTYHTVVVVGDGVGLVRPAWVVTWEQGELQVGYRANAFRDQRGRLHIDARQSRDVGPNHEAWSPDSFAFGHRMVWTIDDRGQGHVAAFSGMTLRQADPRAWTSELQRVQAIIEGGL